MGKEGCILGYKKPWGCSESSFIQSICFNFFLYFSNLVFVFVLVYLKGLARSHICVVDKYHRRIMGNRDML